MFQNTFRTLDYHAQEVVSRQETELTEKSLRDLQAVGAEGEPMERLRLVCLSRGANGILELGRLFRRMNDDGNKPLNRNQFFQGLRDIGLQMTNEEAISFYQKFADDNSGGINTTEFLELVRPPMSEARKNSIHQIFQKIDKNGDGFITLNQLKRVYNVKSSSRYLSGEDSEEKLMNRFLANFEQDGNENGIITYEEFFNYYSAISASIDNDCFFNLVMRQAYKV